LVIVLVGLDEFASPLSEGRL